MNYTKVLTDVLLVVLPTVTGTVGALAARYLLALSKNRRFALLSAVALHAVQAAEEIGLASGGTVKGGEKLAHATSTLMSLAAQAHIKVSSDEATRMVLGALTEFRAALGQLQGSDHEGLSSAELSELLGGLDLDKEPAPTEKSMTVNADGQPALVEGTTVPLTLPDAPQPGDIVGTTVVEEAPTTLP